MSVPFEVLKEHFEHEDRIAELFGVKVLEASKGYAKVTMELTECCFNGARLAHGGIVFTLADLAAGVACNAEQDYISLTAQSSISYVRGGKTGPLTAIAKAVHMGTKLMVFDSTVYDGEGTVMAVARFTMARTSKEQKA